MCEIEGLRLMFPRATETTSGKPMFLQCQTPMRISKWHANATNVRLLVVWQLSAQL